MRSTGLVLLLVLAASPAAAADTLADPASPVGKVGAMIVETAAGVPYEEAFAVSGSAYNPYGLDIEALAAASGATTISKDMTGAAVGAGEFSILPQFNTPGGKFTASAQTPPTIPFAFMLGATCHAGYASGFPAPASTYVVDLADKPCSAYSVDDLNRAAYALIMAGPRALSDAELEQAVRAAYTAAAAFAAANGNYFARDGESAPLIAAVAAALAERGFDKVVVPAEPAADYDAARVCLPAEGTELRVAPNIFGDGVDLVAVTDERAFAYQYDPRENAAVVVVPAAACAPA